MPSKSTFKQPYLAYALLLPQLLVTVFFFILPALQAIKLSFFQSDAFNLHSQFVYFQNFIDLFRDEAYIDSAWVTLVYSILVAVFAMGFGLFLALLCHSIQGKRATSYKTLLIWPYAVAPAVAALLWRFLFNPSVGLIAYPLQHLGYDWNYTLYPRQALFVITVAAVWQQFSYNFLFFLAGLKAIPQALLEAAALDGAGVFRRFWHIIFPLLSPTTFFLLVMNLIYAFFDTFGIIQIITGGGPNAASNTLVYKVYNDGFMGLDLGSSAAQSVILMLLIAVLAFIQFRYIERKVHYK